MAVRSIMVSDLTGAEGSESDFTTLTVRSHPSLSDGEVKALDVLPSEVANLAEAKNLVIIELGSNGDRRQVVVTLDQFRKVCPDDVVKKARSNRGRRPGTVVKKD